MEPPLEIGISLPVLNDREPLGQVLQALAVHLDGVPYTVCIVDDGSTDGTVELVEALRARDSRLHLIRRVKRCYGCQRGAASRVALEWLVANTASPVFVEMDADGARQPAELLGAARLIGRLEYDVAIASKFVHGSRVLGRPLRRRLISVFYSWLARCLLGRGIRDYSSTFRCYSREAAEALLARTPVYASPVYYLEILATWMANEFRIIEIPTVYVERTQGRSKVTAVDLLKGLLGTLEIARRFHRGGLAVPAPRERAGLYQEALRPS